jgi:methylthioribulose-1-phosphate dehydratase
MPDLDRLANEIVEVSRRFYDRGWVLGTSGNFSAVVGRDPLTLAITSSGIDKSAIETGHILEVDEQRRILRGNGKPSAETLLHFAVVMARGAGAVLHTHSVWSNILSDIHAESGGFKIRGQEMLKGLEGVTSHEHSEWVPIVENSQDMIRLSQKVDTVLRDHRDAHGFLIRSHGLYTWGKDLGEARRHIEIFEYLFEVVGRSTLASRS